MEMEQRQDNTTEMEQSLKRLLESMRRRPIVDEKPVAKILPERSVMDGWGIPELYRRPLGELVKTHALHCMLEWAVGDGTFCILAGDLGIGKTTAAAQWLMREAINTGNHSGIHRWWSSDAIGRLGAYSREIDSICSVRYLVIDGLGFELLDGAGVFRHVFESIISARYANKRKTAITTNMTMEQFKGRYGPYVFDRTSESGAWYNITGASMRNGAR
jgi:DNA replication protein DnaC